MSRRKALIVTLPTRGHINHGIALAELLQHSGLRPVILTGLAAAGWVRKLSPPFEVHLSPNHDFVMDRADVTYRPHLEQLSSAQKVRLCHDVEADLISKEKIDVVICKDYISATLSAQTCGVPWMTYYSDGIEAALPSWSQQVLADAERRSHMINEELRGRGVTARLDRPVTEALQSPYLNLVRGFAELDMPGTNEDLKDLRGPCARLGFLTYDGSPQMMAESARDLQQWPAESMVYASFGTVTRDRQRFELLPKVAELLSQTMLIASPHALELVRPSDRWVVAREYVPNVVALEKAICVVHHGGFGTTLSAVQAGKPALVLPDNPRASQRYHGEALRALGLGDVLTIAEGVSAAAIAARLEDLVGDENRSRAQKVATKLRVRDAFLKKDAALTVSSVCA